MRLKRKIPSFVFGVSIGLVIGLGFFVFKINDLFNKLKDSAREQITVIQQPVKNVPVESEDTKKKRDRFKIDLGKSKKINYSEVDSLIRSDAEITIATDELLTVKNVKIIQLDNNLSSTDTLVAKLANVNTPSSADYQVEFWRTPLNAKGYRFLKNKVMLYGFVDFNDVSLYGLENNHYIKCSGQVYRLYYGGDFMQLERVTDNELLTRLN